MVDSRSAGLIGGIAGGINFRSGDTSGTAAKTADDRASQGTEYFVPVHEEEQIQDPPSIDRSIELRASLTSLALLNVVTILRNNKKKSIISADDDLIEKISFPKVEKISSDNSDSKEKD